MLILERVNISQFTARGAEDSWMLARQQKMADQCVVVERRQAANDIDTPNVNSSFIY